MANVLINENSMTAIANAIRAKNGTSTTYKPSEMAGAISAIDGGGSTPTGTIQITSNGTHDVSAYASANVAVPTGSTPTGTKQISITENGTTTEDVSAYANAQITVNVPSSDSSNKFTGTVVLENTNATYLTIPITDHTLKTIEKWIVFCRATKTGEYADGATTWYDSDGLTIPSAYSSDGYFVPTFVSTNKTVSTGTISKADGSATANALTITAAKFARVYNAPIAQAFDGRAITINTANNAFSIYSGNASYYFCKEGASVEYTYEAYLLD